MSDIHLTQKEREALAVAIGIGFILLTIVVAIILLAQFIFWVSVIIFFFSIIYFIFALFVDIPRLINGEDYFDEFPHLLLALGLLIVFWMVAHIAFPIEYSPTSQKILEFAGQVEEVRNLPWEIQNQALRDICASTQNNPSCEMIINVQETQEAVEGVSSLAKLITWTFNLKVKFPN